MSEAPTGCAIKERFIVSGDQYGALLTIRGEDTRLDAAQCSKLAEVLTLAAKRASAAAVVAYFTASCKDQA